MDLTWSIFIADDFALNGKSTHLKAVVNVLDKFDALVNDLSIGLPAELAARRKQYEYYRDQLLTFKDASA